MTFIAFIEINRNKIDFENETLFIWLRGLSPKHCWFWFFAFVIIANIANTAFGHIPSKLFVYIDNLHKNCQIMSPFIIYLFYFIFLFFFREVALTTPSLEAVFFGFGWMYQIENDSNLSLAWSTSGSVRGSWGLVAIWDCYNATLRIK